MELKVNNFSLRTNEISLVNNNLPVGNFKLAPQIQRKVGKINEKENLYFVEVRVEITNKQEAPFPINLTASITGFFDITCDDKAIIYKFLEIQGFQMVFPHIRALVATVTASSMMPSITLPLVNPNQFTNDNVVLS